MIRCKITDSIFAFFSQVELQQMIPYQPYSQNDHSNNGYYRVNFSTFDDMNYPI